MLVYSRIIRVALIYANIAACLFYLTSMRVQGTEEIQGVSNIACANPTTLPANIVRMKITAYCPCGMCSGSWAELGPNRKVKLGRIVTDPYGVAADPQLLPYGTILNIPGVGECIVDDTGGAMRTSAVDDICHIDLRFPTHEEAKQWGVRELAITILNPLP